MKIARMIAIQMGVYATGFSSDHASGTPTVPVLPNASRAACAADDTGFHSANVCNGPGMSSLRTNALEMKVRGMMNMNDALLTTSTPETFNPTKAMIQEIAYANSNSSRKPPIAST